MRKWFLELTKKYEQIESRHVKEQHLKKCLMSIRGGIAAISNDDHQLSSKQSQVHSDNTSRESSPVPGPSWQTNPPSRGKGKRAVAKPSQQQQQEQQQKNPLEESEDPSPIKRVTRSQQSPQKSQQVWSFTQF